MVLFAFITRRFGIITTIDCIAFDIIAGLGTQFVFELILTAWHVIRFY